MNGENAAAASSVPNLVPPTSSNKCLGTRRLTSLRHENGNSSTGMIATFCAYDNETSPYLLVLVTEGSMTFSGPIFPNEAKRVLWNHHLSENNEQQHDENIRDETKVQILSSFLLQDQEGMTVTYNYMQQGEGIQLEIKHRMGGVTRILGSHTLTPTESNLSFCTSLGTVINDSIAEIHRLETKQTTIQTHLSSWKDTAEKLDRDWQAEKDVLLHRFLQLYKKAHAELGESQTKVQQLEQELMQARAAAAHNESPTHKKRSRPPPPALAYAALPDDADAEQFDSSMVEMLATGKTIDKPSVGKKRKNSHGSGGTTGVGAMRTNPHTGAKEVFDANALFDDPSFFASQTMDPTTTNAQPMDTESSTGNGEMENKTTNANRQDNDDEVDPVMAIASKLPAKKRANNDDDSPTTKHAKKDLTHGKKDPNTVTTEEVDPIMAAAGKLFAKENSSSNGGSK